MSSSLLPPSSQVPNCWNKRRPYSDDDPYDDPGDSPALNNVFSGLLVVAQTADDMSFVHSGWNNGIERWRFNLPAEAWTGPVLQRTIFDRPLYRAGEIVHMKHILRSETLAGFSRVPAAQRPTAVRIEHLGSDEKYELPLQWNDQGIAETTWPIPNAAKLGRYIVTPTNGDRRLASAGEFQVQEFRVPLMKGVVHLPAQTQVAPSAVPAALALQYLSGGPASKAPVILRAQIKPRLSFSEPGYPRFLFANGSVPEGRTRSAFGDEDRNLETAKSLIHQRNDINLDAAGTASVSIENIPAAAAAREIIAEMEYHDPSGEVQTASATVSLWPSRLSVGIAAESWVQTGPRIKVKAAVVDLDHKPVAGAAVHVDILQRKRYENRKRLVGGFYAYETVSDVRRVDDFCDGVTDAAGILRCESIPATGGNLILQASVKDSDGRIAVAHDEVWGGDASEDWVFDQSGSDRIDLLPEKRRYEPGDTARLQVRIPFREATALVTTEREGVLDAWVTHLSGNDPIVEVPVKASFAPNMFVSVLAIRGRIGDVQPTAMVDLGRPAFKLGIAEVEVGWGAHELAVDVHPDHEVYPVRARAKVDIAVHLPDGSPPPPGSEVALAAVDEGLLELQPNRSWEILPAFMQRRGYEISTATAQLQVVGKRHYGLKALPQGGGGGHQGTRELFDTLLFWQGRVPLDDGGRASVEVPLNDSLTGFRIVAVATAGSDRFGTGSATIRSTQDLMILPGIAPIAREGDQFEAQVAVRNTTGRAMQVAVEAQVEGISSQPDAKALDLAPTAADTLTWHIAVDSSSDTLQYTIKASEPGGARDEVRVKQKILPAVPVRTYQATLLQLTQPQRQSIAAPQDALPNKGGLVITAARSLAGSLETARQWMLAYPYDCLEQRISRAVALGDDALWAGIVATLPTYVDANGLLKFFPNMDQGSDALTSYVVAISTAAHLSLPDDVQRRLEDGLRRFVNGSSPTVELERYGDLPLRKLAAIASLANLGKADAGLLASVRIEPNLWPTSAVLDWWNILLHVGAVADRSSRLAEAEQIVRSRLNLQGTQLTFSTAERDSLSWLMVDSEVNAARLDLLLIANDQWREQLPRLVEGTLRQRQRGHWQSTPANAWGTLAVQQFAATFESTPVTGVSNIDFDQQHAAIDWAGASAAVNKDLTWPQTPAELSLGHTGSGAPWITIDTRAAIPLKEPIASGYRITRMTAPVEPRSAGTPKRGDVIRVHLDIEAQTDMTWVVVDDPIPTGASHLGSGLAHSTQAAAVGNLIDQPSPAFVERPADAFRAYYAFLPKGTLSIEYTLRLNQAGHFRLPNTRVEALYAPEMFGEIPNADVEVEP
ncbi:MAG: hypothetical protein HY270_10020 [Deltaproteobacteria bacterium]|nr:hypothetical protein [Deltaproteobacteria bacterium]